MEESKELQGFYKIFRAVVYVSVLLEFFEYAIDPAVFDQWGGILTDIHGRIKRWTIYQDGHLVYSKIASSLCSKLSFSKLKRSFIRPSLMNLEILSRAICTSITPTSEAAMYRIRFSGSV